MHPHIIVFFALVNPCISLLGFSRCVAAEAPVKVFILSGQSNMEGKAAASTLEAVIKDAATREQFQHLKVGGKWAVRDDVWVTYLDRAETPASPLWGPLSVGFGSPKRVRDESGKRTMVPGIGPELGIGWVLGDYFDEPVLLIKAAWGGRSLKYSFRPPSAMPTDEEVKARLALIQKKNPDKTLDELKQTYGSDYRKLVSETHRVLRDLKRFIPNYNENRGFEIAGFIWFQGWNDGVGSGNPNYTEQLAHFIRDLRRDLQTPNLRFVIGELGIDGPDAGGWVADFRKQQAVVPAMPEFKDNVRLAKTSQCWHTGPASMAGKWDDFRKLAKTNEQKSMDDPTRSDPKEFFQKNWVQRYKDELAYTSDRRYHYNGSGRSYYEMGESMGNAMIELLRLQE